MPLNHDEIAARLDAWSVECHDEITSTNDRAAELARAGSAQAVIHAEAQSAGRGRRGARWVAPAGSSVLCSLLVHPAVPLPPHHLSILSGVGLARALAALDVPATIKWPNDIMVQDRKVAGILVETVNQAAVIGVGVNCRVPDDAFPQEARGRAGSLHAVCGRDFRREDVLVAVVEGVEEALRRVEAGGILKVLYDWNMLNWLKRRKVRVSGPLGVVEGEGLFLDGRRLVLHVFKDGGVVAMPLSSTVEAR